MAKINKLISKKNEGGSNTTPKTYAEKVKAGQKAGLKIDQPGAYKAGLTDTTSTTYLKSPKGEYAGVRKPVKKSGGQTKSKRK